jgi:hypothetical protein
MKINGACHCGDITFAAEVDPQQVLLCHCTDCQTLSGSAFRSVAPAIPGSFRLLSGKLSVYIKIAEDDTPREQTFCPRCGTPIYAGPIDGQSGSWIYGSGRLRSAISCRHVINTIAALRNTGHRIYPLYQNDKRQPRLTADGRRFTLLVGCDLLLRHVFITRQADVQDEAGEQGR